MKELNELGKKINGSVLTIGFDDDTLLIKRLKNNKNIKDLYTLVNLGNGKRKKSKKLAGDKNINIKKLFKELEKRTFDYIICDFDTITPFFRSFIKNSILVANKEIFLFVQGLDYEHEQIVYRYKRYGAKIKKVEEKDNYLFKIEVNGIKVPFFKSFIYWFKDISYDFVEFIADILIG